MRILLLTLLALSSTVLADGPGSRIRATPSGPVAPTPSDQTKPVERDLQRCGPESTGAGSGTGTGSSAAPR